MSDEHRKAIPALSDGTTVSQLLRDAVKNILLESKSNFEEAGFVLDDVQNHEHSSLIVEGGTADESYRMVIEIEEVDPTREDIKAMEE